MKKIIISLSFVMLIVLACEKENQEDLSNTCKTENMSYSTDLSPILSSNCTSCHNAQSSSGGVMLHDYANVKVHVDNGSLLGAIKHESGFSSMPQGQEKLPECNISVIEAWVNQGALDN